MSKLRLSSYDGKPKTVELCGIEWQLYHSAMRSTTFTGKLLALLSDKGLVLADYTAMNSEEQAKWMGRAVACSFVAGFTPFDIELEGGERINVVFDAPSDEEFYDTMGEEFIGENDDIQNELIGYASRLENFKNKSEGKILGNSSAPSDSTGAQPDITLTSSTETSQPESPVPSS